jgi:hypothetical protein
MRFSTCSEVAIMRRRQHLFSFLAAVLLVAIFRSQGIFTIAAATASEEAQESKELGHGLLSYSLLAGLEAVERGPLADKYVQPSGPEGVVDVMEWLSFAAGQVPRFRLTENLYGASQDVQVGSQGTSFPVLPLEE